MRLRPDEAHQRIPDHGVSVEPLRKLRLPGAARFRAYKASQPGKVKSRNDEYNLHRLNIILNLSEKLPQEHPSRLRIAQIISFLRNGGAHSVRRQKPHQTIEIPDDVSIRLLLDMLHLCNLRKPPPNSLDVMSGMPSKQPLDKSIAALYALERDPTTNTAAAAARGTSIWSIPVTTGGLQEWSVQAREQIENANPGLIIDPEYSTTCSPAAMISSWHIDQTYGGTVLVGLDNPKLFLICPPTEKNMAIYSKIDEFGYTDQSYQALLDFEQLSYIVLTKGDVYILPAGYIHMVVSMCNSAVGGMGVL
jgi:hypothetical protein